MIICKVLDLSYRLNDLSRKCDPCLVKNVQLKKGVSVFQCPHYFRSKVWRSMYAFVLFARITVLCWQGMWVCGQNYIECLRSRTILLLWIHRSSVTNTNYLSSLSPDKMCVDVFSITSSGSSSITKLRRIIPQTVSKSQLFWRISPIVSEVLLHFDQVSV